MVPVLTIVGVIVSLLISTAVVTETIFSIPGIGQLLTSAIFNRDYPLIQGGLLLVTIFVMIVNIAVDIAYAWVDPRVRFERPS
jgi:peptide/nickel transport system permease protein